MLESSPGGWGLQEGIPNAFGGFFEPHRLKFRMVGLITFVRVIFGCRGFGITSLRGMGRLSAKKFWKWDHLWCPNGMRIELAQSVVFLVLFFPSPWDKKVRWKWNRFFSKMCVGFTSSWCDLELSGVVHLTRIIWLIFIRLTNFWPWLTDLVGV